jgi:hypothetical protein
MLKLSSASTFIDRLRAHHDPAVRRQLVRHSQRLVGAVAVAKLGHRRNRTCTRCIRNAANLRHPMEAAKDRRAKKSDVTGVASGGEQHTILLYCLVLR